MLDVNTDVSKRIAVMEEQIDMLKRIHEGKCTCLEQVSGTTAKKRWQERYHKHGSKSILWSKSASSRRTESAVDDRRSRRGRSGKRRNGEAYWKLLAVFIGYVSGFVQRAVP